MSEEVIVGTAAGLLRGKQNDGVAAFKGIAYGGLISGRRRWQRSVPIAAWKGVKDAFRFGPRAIQPESRDVHVTSGELEELMGVGAPSDSLWREQSEECLTLSVWTPGLKEQRKLPVMFWCHGGKYFGETPPVWWFDGENLARREDVVVVTVRHRVGVLGFLHLADLPGGSAYRDSSNIGMLDLIDALKWVRQNIGGFGGDSDNVTIFGESGGGLKVSVLLRMPDARGWFQKAIIQSGAQMEAFTRAQGTDTTLALLAELGLEPDDIDKLLDVPSEQLVRAQIRLTPNFRSRLQGAKLVEFEPVIDGTTLPDGSFDPTVCPVGSGVPLLIGNCATETTFFLSSIPGVFDLDRPRLLQMLGGMFGADSDRLLSVFERSRPEASPTDILFAITGDFLFRQKSIRMAELKAVQLDAPVFMYLLGFETDVHGGKYHTPHILDLPLVFAHPDHPILGSDPARISVSRQMSGAWAAFARSGNPSTHALPNWPAYEARQRATMFFNEPPQLLLDPHAVERVAWLR